MQLIFNIRKIIICTLVLSFFVAPFPNFTARVAEAATEINYQGKLMTSSNVAVPDGLYNMEFKLYTVSSGGSAIWTETRTGASKVQVTSGLFTVLLGSETSLSGINFDQTIYLGVNIGGTGTPSWDGEMSPRKKFASAPSAFVSDTAKSLDATYATSTNLITTNASTTNLYASSTFTNALTINSYSGLLIGTNGLVSAIATSSLGLLTTNVAEGSNLYFTDQRADARVNAVLSATTSLPNITTLAGLTTAGNLATVGTLTSGSIGSGFGNINIGSNTFTGNGSGLTALNASNISTGVLAIARGGTGTTTAPTFGQLLMGNALGGYDLVATSTLGISSGSGTVNSGTAGQVAFYNSTGTALSGTSTLFFANGNVGVGSTSPIADFSVQGKAFVGAGQKLLSVVGALSSGWGGGIDLITGSGGDVNIRSQPTSGAGSGSINLTTDDGDEYGGAINMTAGSGFGIGGSLQLTGGNTTGDPVERGGSITLNPGSGMSVGQDGYINIASTRGYVGIGTTGVSSARLTIKGLASATSILNIASSTGTTFFSFQSNGRFGIGTTTPSAKLAVTGTAGTEDLFNIASSTNASLFKIGATGATYFNNNAGTLGMVLLSNGTGASPTWVATSSLGISGGGGSGTVNSGTAGQVAFYNSTGTVVSGTSTLFFANGNVGIGTTTPSKLFTIAGEQYVTGTSTLSNIRFASSTFTMSYLNSTTLGDLVFAEGTAGGIKLYAKDNTGASSNIDFRGNNNRVTLTNVDIASAIYSGIQNITTPWLGSTNSSGGDVSWAISKTGNGASQTISALTQVYASSVDGPKLVIGANGIDFAMRDNSAWNEGVDFTAMVIASSTGYVGIGTTTPSTALVVNSGQVTVPRGNVSLPSYSFSEDSDTGIYASASFNNSVLISGGGATGLIVSSSAVYAGTFSAGRYQLQNVAPSASAPSYSFISDTNSGMYQVSSDILGFSTNGTNRLTITDTGNVGIGTTTPSAKLAVTGTAGTGDIFNIASSTEASLFKIGATGATYFNNDAGTLGMVLLSNGTGSSPTWVATSSLGISGGGGGSGTVNSGLTGQVAFYAADGTAVSGTSTLFFANGNVGIGTTTPGSKLHVDGKINVSSGNWYSIDNKVFAFASTTNQSVILGLNAGNLATTSDSALYATAVGIDSLKVLTSGTFNTALGWRTGNGISTGTGNTAVGANAFSSSNGSRNTALGSLSLNQTSGSNNIGIGFQHASYGISGSGNILMGANVLLPSTSGSGQLNIGNVLYGSGLYNSDSTQSSAYSGGRIGIGTTTPSAILAIQGTSTNPTTDLFRVASSTGSPLFAISSAGKVGIGSDPNSLYALSITGGLVITGSANAFGAGAIGISGNALTFAGGSSGYEFRSSANSPQVTISSAGSLGIGTTTPSAKLAVTGTAGTGDIFNIASSTNASLFKIGATGATYFNNDAGTLGMVLLSNGTGSSPTWVATSTLGISGGGGSGTVNSGTAGQVAFYNSTGTAVSGTSTLFFANGNVGIGTTTPGSALTVVGTTTIAGPIRVGMSSNDAVIIGDITGNARGTKAIDIQTRAADTEVASGPTSVAVGYRNRVTGTQGSAFGTENKVDGNYATAVGYYNTANGSKAVALGTENNLGTNLLAIGVGYNNVVSDWYSTAVGYSNTVSAYQSVAVGMNLTNNIAYSYMMGPSQSAAATILSTGEFKAPFFNATSTTGTSTFAGYVGIGTTTPGSLLTVAGNVSITGGITIPVTTSGGLGVVTMGSSRFIHGYGGTQTNVFMGPNAGNLTNTGRDSIGIGSNALVGLTSARLAVAVGSGALERNSSGWSNTAIGESALNFVTTNGNNTAVGRRALYGTTGENNTAIGTQAGESGSSGSNNIYLGYLAGDNLTTGSSNIILGTNIDFASTTASNQLNIGNLIFSQGITGTGTTLSTGNIGIGVSNPAYKLEVNGTSSAQALRLPEFDAGGAGVLFMGSNRFLYGNNGSENTFVGAGAGKLSSPGVANTAVGQGSMINISSGGNYNVALGGTNIRSLTTGDSNIAIGYQTMYDLGTGDNNIAIGRQAGYLITGSNNILLGYQAGKLNSGSTNIVIGYDINAPVGSGSNQLVIGNLIYGTSIDGTNTTVSSGNIGIGTSTPNQKLVVAGTIQATNLLGGSTNLTVDANGNIIRDPSDQGLKENIVTLEGSLAKIEQLRGVRYEWKDKLRFGTSTEIGVIAQEVELVVPEVVSSGGVYKSVNIKNLVALLIEGVKELKVQVDVVKDKVVAISAWFGSGGDSLNVKGQICVDDVCVTKDQFKQILINSGSVMSQPASSGSAGGGTGPSVESGTGTSPSETPSGETGSSAPVNGGAEETGGSSGGDTASSDEAVTPSGSTESAPTTEPTTPPVVSTPPTESVASEPAPAPSPAPTE